MNSMAPWCLVSTRPLALNAALAREVAAAGGKLIPLETIEIEPRWNDNTVTGLMAALRSDFVLFTSPAAAEVAADWLDLPGLLYRRNVLATGAGTQKTLANRGIRQARAPVRMDSEGLLAMPELEAVEGCRIGLITGVGGRGVLQPALEARGATVERVDVYARVFREVPSEEWQVLGTATTPVVIAVTSGDAFEALMQQVPVELDTERWRYVAASDRLAQIVATKTAARSDEIAVAASPMPEALVFTILQQLL